MKVKYKIVLKKNKKEIVFSKYKTLLKYIIKIEDDNSYLVLKISNGIWFDISEYVKG